MFDSFTDAARRSLFFARAKTSEREGEEISTEDLLGGLLLASPDAVVRFASREEKDRIRPAEDGERWFVRVESREESGAGFKVPMAREIPFSAATKRAIQCAVEEADALGHKGVRPEHLLLGLLREEGTEAWGTLHEAGVRLKEARRILGAEPGTDEPFHSDHGSNDR